MNCSSGIKTLDATLYKAAAMNCTNDDYRIYAQPRAQESSHYARTLYIFLAHSFDLVDLPAYDVMLTTLLDIVSLYPAEGPVKGFIDGIDQMCQCYQAYA